VDWRNTFGPIIDNGLTVSISDYTAGSVTNPEGSLTPGGDPTILTRPVQRLDYGRCASNRRDFGQNIVGYLSINLLAPQRHTGLPGIRLAFSESIQYGYLTSVSDFSRSDNVSIAVHTLLKLS